MCSRLCSFVLLEFDNFVKRKVVSPSVPLQQNLFFFCISHCSVGLCYVQICPVQGNLSKVLGLCSYLPRALRTHGRPTSCTSWSSAFPFLPRAVWPPFFSCIRGVRRQAQGCAPPARVPQHRCTVLRAGSDRASGFSLSKQPGVSIV